MKIVEMNTGEKIAYKLNGTRLSFADGYVATDLARQQRDWTVTKDVMVDADGGLVIGAGRSYVAQIEIPPMTYTETPGPDVADPSGEGTMPSVIRTPDPLNTDDVTLRLWSIVGIGLDI